LLEKGKAHHAVFDWLVERRYEDARAELQGLTTAIAAPGRVLAENLGALWMSLFRRADGVPPTDTVSGLALGDVELASRGWSSLTMVDCTVVRLAIPSVGAVMLAIPHSYFDTIEAGTEQRFAAIVRDADPDRINTLLLGSTFTDSRRDVRAVLERLGMVAPAPRAEQRYYEDTAQFYFEKMSAPVVVYEADSLTDDDRLRWTKRFGDDTWKAFLAAITRHGLARWEPITASGRPKVRLVFDIAPALIADRTAGDARVTLFWQELRALAEPVV